MTLKELQEIIRKTYLHKDRQRGLEGTFMWFAEEVGELAQALRKGDREALRVEFSDTLAWLLSLANLAGVDMEEAARRYAHGCPKCGHIPCRCGEVRNRYPQEEPETP